MRFLKQGSVLRVLAISALLWGHSPLTAAPKVALSTVDFNILPSGNWQLTFEMTGQVAKPKIFTMDNPARIVLDFVGVKSALKQKKNIINAKGVNSYIAVEAEGRLRVVINLIKLVTYQVSLRKREKGGGSNSQVAVVLNSLGKMTHTGDEKLSKKTLTQLTSLIPKQTIDKIDFRRGEKGGGRLLIYLTNPNTVVNTQEKSGKIELDFLNTNLPPKYAKKMDVFDFATPVSIIEAKKTGNRVKILITPINHHFTFALFQTDGLVTVEVKPVTIQDAEKRKRELLFTGKRLSLNFQDIEVRSALSILADFTNLNIIVTESVAGRLTLRMNDAPWDQVLNTILKSKGLSKRQTGGVIFIAPTAEIKSLIQAEKDLREETEQSAPIETEYIQINYARAEDFKSLLSGESNGNINGCSISVERESGGSEGSSDQSRRGSSDQSRRGSSDQSRRGSSDQSKKSFLSNEGTVAVDSRTNTLIIRDTEKIRKNVRRIIKRLDKPLRQVLIEARVVIAEEGFAQELGARFGAVYPGIGHNFSVGSTTGSNLRFGDMASDAIVSPILSSLAVTNPYGALGMTLAKGANYALNLEITARQDDNKAEFVSNPKVFTSDGCEAIIKRGEKIPYETTTPGDNGRNLITITFEDAFTSLKVKPQITPNGSVIMALDINRDTRGEPIRGIIPINRREINTTVQVKDGETVVLGGVYTRDMRNDVNKVPWFADLPLIGWLFKKTIKEDEKRELLIFITPKIVKDLMRIH